MFPHIKVELRAEDKFFGPGVCELLELIEQTGSLQSACTEMGLSYSKGSRMLRGIERQLGVRQCTDGLVEPGAAGLN